jgi:hypothetical protein
MVSRYSTKARLKNLQILTGSFAPGSNSFKIRTSSTYVSQLKLPATARNVNFSLASPHAVSSDSTTVVTSFHSPSNTSPNLPLCAAMSSRSADSPVCADNQEKCPAHLPMTVATVQE